MYFSKKTSSRNYFYKYELVFDVHKKELGNIQSIIKQKMESAVQISVPLEVDIGTGISWLEAH